MSFVAGLVLGLIGTAVVVDVHQPETETVFVYGTLANPVVRTVICWCWAPGQPATLPGYAQRGRTLAPSSTATVTGSLLTVSSIALWRFDFYEGTPHYYQRERISIANELAWVYRKVEP